MYVLSMAYTHPACRRRERRTIIDTDWHVDGVVLILWQANGEQARLAVATHPKPQFACDGWVGRSRAGLPVHTEYTPGHSPTMDVTRKILLVPDRGRAGDKDHAASLAWCGGGGDLSHKSRRSFHQLAVSVRRPRWFRSPEGCPTTDSIILRTREVSGCQHAQSFSTYHARPL